MCGVIGLECRFDVATHLWEHRLSRVWVGAWLLWAGGQCILTGFREMWRPPRRWNLGVCGQVGHFDDLLGGLKWALPL